MDLEYWKKMCIKRATDPNTPKSEETYQCPFCQDLGQVIAAYAEDGTPLWTHCECVKRKLEQKRRMREEQGW